MCLRGSPFNSCGRLLLDAIQYVFFVRGDTADNKDYSACVDNFDVACQM
jgi:hypothetical protein